VRLSAAHLAGRVQIEVLDDGGGMDPERLKAKAIEKASSLPTKHRVCQIPMPSSSSFPQDFPQRP